MRRILFLFILASTGLVKSFDSDWDSTNLSVSVLWEYIEKNGGCLRDNFHVLACIDAINKVLSDESATFEDNQKLGIFHKDDKSSNIFRKLGTEFVLAKYEKGQGPLPIFVMRGKQREKVLLSSKREHEILTKNEKSTFFLDLFNSLNINRNTISKGNIGGAINRFLTIGKGAYHSIIPLSLRRKITSGTYDKMMGLGVFTLEFEKRVFIQKVVKGSRAEEVGLKVGDEILLLNNEGVEGNIDFVTKVRKLSGKSFRLKVLRKRKPVQIDFKKHRIDFDVTKSELNPLNISQRKVEGTSYLSLRSFSERGTCLEMYRLLEKIESPEDGIILDFRGNGGGSERELLCLIGIFFPKEHDGEIVFREHEIDKEKTHLLSTIPFSFGYSGADFEQRYLHKITVVVDGNSASASEAFAGYLKYKKRANIVGYRTFGKGSTLVGRQVPGGLISWEPSSLYYFPNGITPQNVGVLPDYNFNITHFREPREFRRERDSHFRPIHIGQERNSLAENKTECLTNVLKQERRVKNKVIHSFHGDWELFYAYLVHHHC